MNDKTATANQTKVIFEPIKEDTWKFFDADAFNSLENTRLVAVNQLIFDNEEMQFTSVFDGKQNPYVYKAYSYFRRISEGDTTVKPREPLKVRDNEDGTFTIIDGLATTSAARILGWEILPVQIIETT